MAKVTYLGFQKDPDEGSQHAYDVLTGRKKPFYVVFGRPKTTSKQPEKDKDDQAEFIDNELER